MNTILGIIIYILMKFYRGWVLKLLWGWFVVPVFALPVITVPVAVGLIFLTTLFTPDMTLFYDSDDTVMVGVLIANNLVIPTVALVFGWFLLGLI